MLPNRISEICQVVIKRNGYFTTREMEFAENEAPRFAARPCINGKPDRMKICPICLRNHPILEFLLPSATLRTVTLFHRTAGEEFAYPCADVSEICSKCGE